MRIRPALTRVLDVASRLGVVLGVGFGPVRVAPGDPGLAMTPGHPTPPRQRAALALWATPTFWLGLILLVALGAGIGGLPGLFPVGGMRSAHPAPGAVAAVLDVGRHLVLPCLTLVAVQYGQYHLLMRSSVAAE